MLDGGGDFSLIDHDGKPFSLASQRGGPWSSSGTFCPDACPTTLSKLASSTANR